VRRVVPSLLLTLIVAACGADDAAPAPTAPTSTSTALGGSTGDTPTTAATAFPPHTFDGLAPILDPMVEPLGFRVTRAALISLDDYQPTPDGTHLAVYVVPIDDLTPDEHALRIVPLAAALLPDVFDHWPGLVSFDVCQEPFGWDGEGTPPSYTILDLDRASAATVDWTAVELSELIALSRLDPDVTLSVHAEVGRSAAFEAAVDGS
jgi:hypothetical protein